MEAKALKVVTALAVLEGIFTLWMVLATSSSPKNAWLFHYSVAWLVMILLVLIQLAVLLWLFIQLHSNPEVIVSHFQRRFQRDEQVIHWFILFFVLWSAGVFLFVLPDLSNQVVFQHLCVYLVKARPLLGWLTALCAQFFLLICVTYASTITRPAGWKGTAANIRQWFHAHGSALAGMGWVGGICLFVLVPFSPAFTGMVPAHDSGIFLYFGQRILAGDIPFRDLWDHKPPLIFFIDAFGLWFGNGSLWGVWLLEVCSLLAAVFFTFHILGEKIEPNIRFFAVGCMMLNLPLVLEGGNLTEEFALPFQLASLYFYLKIRSSKHPFFSSFLIGAAFANTILLKQTMVGVWLTMLLMGLVEITFFKQSIQWRSLLASIAGFAVVLGIWIGYFLFHHALWDFWDVAFRYNFIYSDISIVQRVAAFKGILGYLFQSVNLFFAAVVVWMGTAIFIIHNQKTIDRTLNFCLLNIPIEILLVSISGKDYRHYFMSLLPGFTIFIGYCGYFIFNRVKIFRNDQTQLLLCDFLFILLGLQGLFFVIKMYRQKPEIPITQTVQYIERYTQPEDTVLIWGSQSTINFLSERRSPTRFVHQKPLYQAGYTSPALIDEFLSKLEAAPPEMIIDTYHPSTPFVVVNDAGKCSYPQKRNPQEMDRVFEFVCSHYHRVDYLGKDHWLILQKNEQN
jgi:hypothetical protein